jgi:hypothetical protein
MEKSAKNQIQHCKCNIFPHLTVDLFRRRGENMRLDGESVKHRYEE